MTVYEAVWLLDNMQRGFVEDRGIGGDWLRLVDMLDLDNSDSISEAHGTNDNASETLWSLAKTDGRNTVIPAGTRNKQDTSGTVFMQKELVGIPETYQYPMNTGVLTDFLRLADAALLRERVTDTQSSGKGDTAVRLSGGHSGVYTYQSKSVGGSSAPVRRRVAGGITDLSGGASSGVEAVYDGYEAGMRTANKSGKGLVNDGIDMDAVLLALEKELERAVLTRAEGVYY